MPSDLEKRINRLTSRELRSVVAGLSEVARDQLAVAYKGDVSALDVLARIDTGQADRILDTLLPTVQTRSLPSTDEALRKFLLALAHHKEFEASLQSALERRLLVSIDPVLLGPLLVLLLSIKWKFKIKRTKEGKVEFEWVASKEATPADFLHWLLSSIPGLGSGTEKA